MGRSALARCAALAIVVTCSLPALARAAAPGYGIADAIGRFSAYYDTARFQTLKARMDASGHPLRYVRFFASWDTLATASGAACAPSYDATHGAPAWNALLQSLRDAQTAGLDPLVSVTGGTRDGQQYDPVAEPLYPTDLQYRCGLLALMHAASTSTGPLGRPLQVTEWEVWNEPDSPLGTWNGQPPPLGAPDASCEWSGSTLALCHDGLTHWAAGADYYVQALSARAAADPQDRADTLAAGAFNGATVGPNLRAYARGYIRYLTALGQFPAVWSFHPYDDVVASYAGDRFANTADTAALIDRAYPPTVPAPEIWLTEASANLEDPTRTYDGSPVTCTDGNPHDAGTLGACLDENPTAQANAAKGFLDLPVNAGHNVTRVYWYEFQPLLHFDAGLVSPNPAPNGSSPSDPRPSYCVLAGESVTDAAAQCNDVQVLSRSPFTTICAGITVGEHGSDTLVVDGDYNDLCDPDDQLR